MEARSALKETDTVCGGVGGAWDVCDSVLYKSKGNDGVWIVGHEPSCRCAPQNIQQIDMKSVSFIWANIYLSNIPAICFI